MKTIGKAVVMLACLFMLATLWNPVCVHATDGDLDTGFIKNPAYPGSNGFVRKVITQPDGKILIGGRFTYVSTAYVNRIARLNADGSLDSNFNPGSGADNDVSTIALQSDGKILLGGIFTSVNNTARKGIARLNADGSLDNSFNPTVIGFVNTIAVQSDNKILLGGKFTSVGGVARISLVRLNPDGSSDTGFNPILSFTEPEYQSDTPALVDIELQPDGKILIGGRFTVVNNVTSKAIARLNSDGSLDTTFNSTPNGGKIGSIYDMELQSDGKILIGLDSTLVDGITHNYIARLNADGSLDSTFNPSADSLVWVVKLQADGKILIGGKFISVNGTSRYRITRLNSDGSSDATFISSLDADVTAIDETVCLYSIALQTDGKILIGGNFISVNSTDSYFFARLNNKKPVLEKGDVNGDGKVSLDDAMLVLRILAGLPVGNINLNADVNGDGKIGLEELGFILQKVAELRQ